MNSLKKTALNGFLFGALLIGSQPAMAQLEMGAEFDIQPPSPEIVSYHSYAGLSELVTMICDDAIERFQGFYGPSVVSVAPFVTIEKYQKNKLSNLGVTIADQMIAMINNDTIMLGGTVLRNGSGTPQRLNGVLQEVDGYLRVHISGVNIGGERLSYVANVEMSEPIFRAMHSYL